MGYEVVVEGSVFSVLVSSGRAVDASLSHSYVSWHLPTPWTAAEESAEWMPPGFWPLPFLSSEWSGALEICC